MQVMQHLLLTERGMGGLFKAPQQPANRPNLQKAEQIIGTMADRTQIRNAPERVQPPAIETLSQADAVQLFEAGRLKTLEKAQASDFGIELIGYSSPYFGHMTVSELLVFLAAHCQRHLVQIKQAQI